MESYSGVVCTKTDALYLIQAARKKLVPLVTQRFSNYERQLYIKPGMVFVWNENDSNIRRWTDGRKWSASRVSGAFLSYREMKPAESAGGTCHIVDEKDHGLLKQSFSYCVGSEKYHIVSYMTSELGVAISANADKNASTYQRPSLDRRFKDLQIEELLEGQSEDESSTTIDVGNTNGPSAKKRKLSGCLECEGAASQQSAGEQHPGSSTGTSSAPSPSSTSPRSPLLMTPPSPVSPLPASPLLYTARPAVPNPHPVVLPPLRSILTTNTNVSTDINSRSGVDGDTRQNSFDRQAILALTCNFS